MMQWGKQSVSRRRGVAALAFVVAALPGCGGGLGGEQNPDPVVQDFPVAYVKRPLAVDDQGDLEETDVRDGLAFTAGGDLYLRQRASAAAEEQNLTAGYTGGMGDVKDVSVSFDGSKLLFAMRPPLLENVDEEDQPTWNIWEYDIPTSTLRRIIASDTVAEEGHDVMPHYLPDGRIVFTSTRQRQAKAQLLDEGKPQFAAQDEDLDADALVLHVMDADGSNLQQISFNQSHDLHPTVLSSGEILFSRWDNMGSRSGIRLYRMCPDGRELTLVYGAHSHDTGSNGSTIQFLRPREMPDGRVLTVLQPFQSDQGGGALAVIDVENYVDNSTPTYVNAGVLSGPAQTSATLASVDTNGISAAGRFASAFPLWDGTDRMLVSWSQCRLLEDTTIVPCTPERLQDPAAVEAPPLYGVWIYDLNAHTQLPVVLPEEGMLFSEVVATQPRDLPAYQCGTSTADAGLADEGVGVLNIKSVYDVDGTASADIATLRDPAQTAAADRPARFLRLVKAVGIPSDDLLELENTAFGVSRNQLMREIIGYAPVEPDGSVKIKVPANVPFTLSVLDQYGRRIGGRHQNWLQLRPGETLTCNGCHNGNAAAPHGRLEAQPPSANPGAPADGLPFPNTEPAMFADFGETMAETRYRQAGYDCSVPTDAGCQAQRPAVDLVFQDVWTDPAVRAKDADLALRYADLTTPPPAEASCLTDAVGGNPWTSRCRAVIHYPTHIHPLWAVDRGDDTCTACHSRTDAMAALQVPAAQLELSDGPSVDEPEHLLSYRELLFADNAQEIVEGSLQDTLVQATDANGDPLFLTDADGNLIYQTDAQGELILDGNGDPIPIPVMVPVNITASMSAAGARASRFLDLFLPGGSHEGRLTAAELRLIAEWLDIGAQYYNDPFAVPME